MGAPPPLAPFLGRPGYTPLPRPYDTPRASRFPDPPPALIGMDAVAGHLPPGALVRVVQRLGISLAAVDATMTTDEVLDEMDAQAYIFDVDCAPASRPQK